MADKRARRCMICADKVTATENAALEAELSLARAEVNHYRGERDDLQWHIDNKIRGCQCSDDEACEHVRRAEKAEAENAELMRHIREIFGEAWQADTSDMSDEDVHTAWVAWKRQNEAELVTARAQVALLRKALEGILRWSKAAPGAIDVQFARDALAQTEEKVD